MNRILTLIVLCVCGICAAEEKPLKVVVIGGGPTGLSAAIEAKAAGADVVVVEKRDQYTRENTLFLPSGSLALLEKWGAMVPKMQRLFLKEEKRGFVLIKDLEEDLAKRVHELGILVLRGEFKDFVDAEKLAVIDCSGEKIELPYDILVGADGMHSRVREKLGISISCLAQGICSAAMVAARNTENMIGCDNRQNEEIFIKKITIPFASVLLMQNKPNQNLESIGKNDLIKYSREMGWLEEADLIAAGSAWILENVPVCLQRAAVFSDRQRSAILLGEAAGCTTYYRGNGAHYSFKTVAFAGDFFQHFYEENAFDSFDLNMEKEIDEFIQESRSLFFKE